MSKLDEKRIGQFQQFIAHGDGTLTDPRTGLMWKQEVERENRFLGISQTFSFHQALAIKSNFAGYSDWRLPSIDELRSLLDNRLTPKLDASVFQVNNRWYFWSSTVNSEPDSQFNGYALITTLGKGSSGFGIRESAEHVLLVRGPTWLQSSPFNDAAVLQQVATNASFQDTNPIKSVDSEVEGLSVPDFGIAIAFESAKDAKMKSGDDAIIFNLSICNKGLKQIRVELPLSSYVNRLGEEIEQSAWLAGLLAGDEVAVIRADTFRKVGLVFFKSRLTEICKGDRLYVTVVQLKPAKRICFTLMCADARSRTFMVINAASEDQAEPPETAETSDAMADVLQRVSLLEEGIANLLRKLDTLPRDALPTVADTVSRSVPAHTLQAVLQGLALQDRISSAAFRLQLLPLDLLPSAVVNEINERALDLTGEIALEEVGDQFLVSIGVFDEVLASWDFAQS